MAANGRRTRLRPTERREQILQCARDLFGERGYDQVSLADVASAAGVTRALVQHYFGAKRDLYVAVVRRIVEAARDVPIAVRDARDPLGDRVAATMEAWLAFVESQGEAWLIATAWGTAIADDEVRQVVTEARDVYLVRMLRAYDDVVDDTPASRFAVRSFLFLNEAVCRQWLAGEASREQVHLLLTESLVHSLTRLASMVAARDSDADSRAQARNPQPNRRKP